jgi:hypothetical protein
MSEMRGKNDRHKKEQKIGQKYFVSFSPAAFFFLFNQPNLVGTILNGFLNPI